MTLFLQNLLVAVILVEWQLRLSGCFTISTFPLLIVVSFDGFRHDYINKVPTPHLQRLISEGVVAKWMKNTFVTKTFPNHFSIATGFYEESHGIVGNEMYDPVFNETFHMSNTESKWWDNGKVVPVWVANQLADSDRHSGGMMWAGTNVVIHNQAAFYHHSYDSKVSWEDRVNTAISWITNDTYPANFVLLYFEEPDEMGHYFGPDSKEVEEQIIRVDNITGYLIRKLEKIGLFETTNLIILSDHGMLSVPESHLINMDLILNSSLYKKFGGSPVWNILPMKGQEERVYHDLVEGSKTHNYHVYHKDEIPEEYHYQNNRRIMDILITTEKGWGFIKSDESKNGTKGQHGYNNSIPEMWPLFIARGPDFLQNWTSAPFYNIDLYPLMCFLLHIQCIQTNGSLARVKNMLRHQKLSPTYPSLPTSYIVGIVSLLTLCVIGGIAVVFFTSLRKQTTARTEFDMSSALPHTVRTDKHNASQEEEEKLLNDHLFDDNL